MNAAYVVIEFSHPDKLIPAVEKLESCSTVESWDAVEGHAEHADLVARVRIANGRLPEELRQLDGLKQTTVLEIVDGEEFPPALESLPIRAYVFIDTDPEQKEAVRSAILALPDAISCSRMADTCDLVALIKGETLSQLKRTIKDRIQTLDGVLRLKPRYAFNIKQLQGQPNE
jgi:DNA-binding Lrp family transcriptional regulator